MADAPPPPAEQELPSGCEQLLSGFMNHDYVLTFSIRDEHKRAKLVELCTGPWQGDRVTAHTWEISNDLDPHAMEEAIVELLDEGDRAAYYYLTPPMSTGQPGVPESKRIFRVVLS
jgi:hypothetical protein